MKYIQDVWDLVFSDLKYNVPAVGAVFSIVSLSSFSLLPLISEFPQVSQRVCEWRGKFAREALILVKDHFKSDDFKLENGQPNEEAIADYVAHMLERNDYGYRFVYLNTEEQVRVVSTSTFVSALREANPNPNTPSHLEEHGKR